MVRLMDRLCLWDRLIVVTIRCNIDNGPSFWWVAGLLRANNGVWGGVWGRNSSEREGNIASLGVFTGDALYEMPVFRRLWFFFLMFNPADSHYEFCHPQKGTLILSYFLHCQREPKKWGRILKDGIGGTCCKLSRWWPLIEIQS